MHLYHILINWSQKFWVVNVCYRFILEQCVQFCPGSQIEASNIDNLDNLDWLTPQDVIMFMQHSRLREFSLHELKILFMGKYLVVTAIFSPTSVSRDRQSCPFFLETSRDHDCFLITYIFFKSFFYNEMINCSQWLSILIKLK